MHFGFRTEVPTPPGKSNNSRRKVETKKARLDLSLVQRTELAVCLLV